MLIACRDAIDLAAEYRPDIAWRRVVRFVFLNLFRICCPDAKLDGNLLVEAVKTQ
jgi:hypothetical protein